MPNSDDHVKIGPARPAAQHPRLPVPKYQLTFVDSTSNVVSLFRQISEWLTAPKTKLPHKYYRGEARLPVTEMPSWYSELPNQLKVLFEKPTDPIGIFNRAQDKKRVLSGIVVACVGAPLGWAVKAGPWIFGAAVAGYVVGQLAGAFVFKKREYPPDIWDDYKPQAASWFNSLLVHAVGLSILVLPFVIGRVVTPVKASSKYEVTDISPYLAELEASAKKAGGGGGGGARVPTPPSKGSIPKFAKTQLAPPMVLIPNPAPKLQVQATLLGPPELKLPQMNSNMPWGDPQGVVSPPSPGPGSGSGIGTGNGTGIGSGDGAGLGPGKDGGTGGGPYSVGGNVSAPIPIYKPEPPYSEEARKAKYQGTVVLWIVVDALGNVAPEVHVVKPLGLGLDEKAVETVRLWKFKPALRNGAAVPVRVMVEISFRLF